MIPDQERKSQTGFERVHRQVDAVGKPSLRLPVIRRVDGRGTNGRRETVRGQRPPTPGGAIEKAALVAALLVMASAGLAGLTQDDRGPRAWFANRIRSCLHTFARLNGALLPTVSERDPREQRGGSLRSRLASSFAQRPRQRSAVRRSLCSKRAANVLCQLEPTIPT